MKIQLRCRDYIESQYYNPKYGVKGNRIVTEDVFLICYDDEYIFSEEEIHDKRDFGVNSPLLVCIYCFDMNIKITCFGGPTNKK